MGVRPTDFLLIDIWRWKFNKGRINRSPSFFIALGEPLYLTTPPSKAFFSIRVSFWPLRLVSVNTHLIKCCRQKNDLYGLTSTRRPSEQVYSNLNLHHKTPNELFHGRGPLLSGLEHIHVDWLEGQVLVSFSRSLRLSLVN